VRLGYRPALDGLRALAIVAVIAYHAYPDAVPGGYVGVEVFFVLSGFLITRLLLDEHRETGSIDLRGFYGRRARRLLPAVAVLAAAYVGASLVVDVPRLWPSLGVMAVYLTNWHNAAGHPMAPGLSQMWSLAIEEQFYLVWPFVLAALLRRAPHRVGPVLVALTASSFIWRELLWRSGATANRMYYGSDTRVGGLLLGCLVAWLTVHGVSARLRHLAAPGLAVVAWLSLAPPAWGWASPGFTLTLAALASAALVVAAVDRPWFGPVAVGQRAYGWYLWHPPLLLVAAAVVPAVPGRTVLGLVAMVVVAEGSLRLVERPVLRRGRSVRLALAPARSAPAGSAGTVPT
jgi:peptidoglycan/LPS O-acetylase OafA/YrhL